MRWLLSLPLLALVASPAAALDIIPARSIFCEATKADEKLVAVRVALLDGKVERRYDNLALASLKVGPNVISFTKAEKPLTINGIRLVCEFELPDLYSDIPPAQRWKSLVYTVPLGDVPRVVLVVEPYAPSAGGRLYVMGLK